MNERGMYFIIFGCVVLFMSVHVRANIQPIELQMSSFIDGRKLEAISTLEKITNIESGTMNHTGVRRVGNEVRKRLNVLGFDTRWIDLPPEMKRAGHLIATREGGKGKRLLLIGHLDTVHEKNSSKFHIQGNKAFGPGVQDMKGGIVVMLEALEALNKIGKLDDCTIYIALMGDEEKAGRPILVSRNILLELAKKADVAIGFEFGSNSISDTAIISRRGITRWVLDVSAATGHSSKIGQDDVGNGAILASSDILNKFGVMLSDIDGVTFNPGIILGGANVDYNQEYAKGTASGKVNVISSRVIIEGDLRFSRDKDEQRAKVAMNDAVFMARPHINAVIKFNEGYPAMQNSLGNVELLNMVSRISMELGHGNVKEKDSMYRGAADISFVSPYISSIDGLGAIGGGAHTDEEYVELDTFPIVIKRAALLMHRLTQLN